MKNQYDTQNETVKENAILFLKNNNISLSEAAKHLKLHRSTLSKWAKESGIYVRQFGGAYEINHHTFSEINSEESAYWLGFLYADGWVMDTNSVGLALKKSDLPHIEKYKSFLKYNGRTYENSNAVSIQFRNQTIANDLKRLGCVPRKSLNLKFPTTDQIPAEYMTHFIRGYFDGDGSITNPENCAMGCCLLGTHDMLIQILNTIGIPNAHIRKKNNIYSFQLLGNSGRQFLSFIYDNATVYLDRKYQRYETHLVRYAKRKNYL